MTEDSTPPESERKLGAPPAESEGLPPEESEAHADPRLVQTEEAAPSVQAEEPTPLVQTEEPAPPVQTEEPVPVVQTEEAAPAVQTEESAPVMQAEEPAPLVQTEEAAPPVEPEESAPLVQTEEAAPPVETEEAAPEESDEIGLEATHPDMRWYVIHTYSGYEAKVKAALEERLQVSALNEQFGKILVPTEDVVEVRGGRRRVSTRKYYPGYILIQMVMNTDTWYLIKNTPKVTGFLGGTNDPTPLGEEDVQKILGQMRGEQTVKPRVEFEEGQNVRVVDGPFANFTGVVEAVNHERGKVKIMVTIFGRPTPVELEFLQVEKL
jgi:transcriptional antiterminator NusG